MVVGIQLPRRRSGYFPPRHFFPTTFVYICSENAVHIGGFYFTQLCAACYYETEKSLKRIEVLNFVAWRKIVHRTRAP